MMELPTTDMAELRGRWQSIYLNLQIIHSSTPEKRDALKEFHEVLIAFDKEITGLLDVLEKTADG